MKLIWPFFLFLTAFSSLYSVTEIANEKKVPILTPSLAQQKNVKLRLDNGLEVILISDPNTKESGALLSVQVGSWQDPVDHPGMAHFLEHLLFLGTEKYPEEGDYHRYIRDHGGLANAFTANHLTSYMFSVDNEAFKGALDRFSHFFKTPLFNPSGISRELNAIDQEYEKNVENDDLKLYYVHKQLSFPSHPYHKFNMGNSQSLKNTSRDDLIKWYHEHYSANLMRLLVVSPLNIEELKTLVIENFSDIKNTNKKPLKLSSHYTQDFFLGNLVIIEPIKNERTLTVTWELPYEFVEMKEEKPDEVICHILGHEGEESLLAQLKREHLATNLTCGRLDTGAVNRELMLEIELTDQGFHEYEQVIERIFQTINTMKNQGIPLYLFEEIQSTQKLKYQYQPQENLFNYLFKNGLEIHGEPLSTYPETSKIIQKLSPQTTTTLLNYLTPQNAIFILRAPPGTTNAILDKKEPWLNTFYTIQEINKETLEHWKNIDQHPNIGLPVKNPFIAEKFTVINPYQQQQNITPIPQTLFDKETGIFYFCPDQQFQEPKIYWFINIKTPEVNAQNPEKNVLSEIYTELLMESLKKYSYPASLAGLKYNISTEENGIGITISGFDDKAKFLLIKIFEHMKESKLSFDHFKTIKEMLLKKYQNSSKNPPLEQNANFLKKVIYKNYVSDKEKLTAIRKITQKTFQNYLKDLFKETFFEGIFYGNMTKESAETLISEVQSTFNSLVYLKNQHIKKEIIALPEDKGPFYLENSIKVQGNSAILAIESSPYSFELRASQEILMNAISEPFFTELRTKQQTGYIVFSVGQDIEQHLFNLFAVQSASHDPRDLLSRFELFIEDFLQNLDNKQVMKTRFEKIKDATLSKLKSPAKNIQEMGSLLKKIAFEYNGAFDWMEKRYQTTKTLTYENFIGQSKKMLGRNNKRRLGVLVLGTPTVDKELRYIKSHANEIKKMSLFSR